MSVLLLDENRKPTAAEKFNNTINKGMQYVSQYAQQKQQKSQMSNENEAAKKLGLDLNGIQDPETRKALIVQALKGDQKNQQIGKKQELIQNIIRKGQQNKPSFQDQVMNNKPTQNQNKQPPFMLDEQMQDQGIENLEQQNLGEFDASKMTDEQLASLSAIDPNIARSLQHSKDVSLREKTELRKSQETKNIASRKEEIDFHKETQKFDEDLINKTRIAKNQVNTISTIEKSLASGNVKPGSWSNILKGFGKVGEKVSEAILHEDAATLQASIPALLEGWKEVFGVRLSDADLNLLKDKLPSIGKSVEANRAILKIMKKYSGQTLLRSQIASDIKKNNKGLRPLGYTDKIEERFDEMVKPVKVQNGKTGNIVEIPSYLVGDAVRQGGVVVNE
jgi:hypothetical protein